MLVMDLHLLLSVIKDAIKVRPQTAWLKDGRYGG